MISNDIVIDVREISKVYKLYDRKVDRLKETFHPGKKKYHKEFYALRNVSFQIKKGETVGIIGKNGAGKSTLLKILTGVITPSSGAVEINGRIASLLELGAGFNPEFTGIENIYLNGTIMGYTKEEIDAKLPAILEFADIGEFVYQPVKMYSSGMYVRLAFSVAINVEPEVLIVDEALAVGDARFQLKCFKRLEKLKQMGTTIIFVSHAVDQIRTLCSIGILLNDGKVSFVGDPKEAVVKYFETVFPRENNNNKLGKQNASGSDRASKEHALNGDSYYLEVKPEEIQGANLFGKGGALIDWIRIFGLQHPNIFCGGEEITIQVRYRWDTEFVRLQQIENGLIGDIGLGIALADEKGIYAFGCNNYDAGIFVDYTENTATTMQFSFTMPFLKSGQYFLTLAISCGNIENHVQLRWYDYLIELECISVKKNVYGVLHLDYKIKLL